MKTRGNLSKLLPALMLTITISLVTEGQKNSTTDFTTSPEGVIHQIRNQAVDVIGTGLWINNVSMKAQRHFIRNFDSATTVVWHSNKSGYVAYSKTDDITTRVYYDTRGTYLCQIRWYHESNLAKDIRHIIRSRFYDYKIYSVAEFGVNNAVFYEVILEDDAHWKKIRVVNGEFENETTLNKA